MKDYRLHIAAVCFLIAAIAALLLLTGCAYRHAVVGQCADVATSAWGYHEGLNDCNPIVDDSLAVLIVSKGALLWLTYYLNDEKANAVVAGVGYAAAAWNIGQIARSK